MDSVILIFGGILIISVFGESLIVAIKTNDTKGMGGVSLALVVVGILLIIKGIFNL